MMSAFIFPGERLTDLLTSLSKGRMSSFDGFIASPNGTLYIQNYQEASVPFKDTLPG